MKGIQEVCEKIEFPRETTKRLVEWYMAICADDETKGLFHAAKAAYIDNDEEYYGKALEEIAKRGNIPRKTADLLLLLDCAVELRATYQEKGLSEELWVDTMKDLRNKLNECEKVYGFSGVACIGWLQRYFICERFALGRLQYEKMEFPHLEYKGVIKKGDIVYNCHIPSSGPLLYEDVLDSLRRAYAFYKKELVNGIMPVTCVSWLLYPPHKEIFPDGTNVAKFRALFDIIEDGEDETDGDFWRVFHTTKREKLDSLAVTTGLQRRLKAYLQSGKHMGYGLGVLLFDGEKIL